jgi:hypothetical protein
MKVDLGIVAYGMLSTTASDRTFTHYGSIWRQVLVARYGVSCGASEPGNGFNWCNTVDGMCCAVAEINRCHDEPLLACLVRNAKTGEVGDGYRTAVRIRYGDAEWATLTTPALIRAHANAEMRKCWIYFARNW